MKKKFNRILSLLLVMLMLVCMLPAQAFASLLDNSPEYNQQILEALKELAGSEADAQTCYAALQQYGLLDKKGNYVEDWTIEYQGKEITKDGLREVLSGEYDPESLVWIDGLAVPLEDVKTMLEIDDYVNYIEETYFSDKEWTDEQLASYDSLMKQISTSGLLVEGASEDLTGQSGVNHSARVAVQKGDVDESKRQVTFYVTLTGAAPGQRVTFDYVSLSGSRKAYASESVSLHAGEDGRDEKQITVTFVSVSSTGKSPVLTAGSTVFFVCFRNIKNALFMNGSETLYYLVETAGTIEAGKFPTVKDINTMVSSDVSTPTNTQGGKHYTYDDYPGLLSALRWGIISHVEASIDEFKAVGYDIGIAGSWNGCGGDLAERSANGDEYTWKRVWNQDAYGWVQLATHSYDLTDYPTTKSLSDSLYLYGACYETNPYSYKKTSYIISDTKAPSLLSWSIPEGTYTSGEVIPVTVKFSEPVVPGDGTYLIINDVTVHAAESGASNVLTFPYEVQVIDNTGLYVEKAVAVDIVGNSFASARDWRITAENVELVTPRKSTAFKSVSAKLNQDDPSSPKLELTVQIVGKDDMRQYVGTNAEKQQAALDRITQWLGSYTSENPKGSNTYITQSEDGARCITAKITDGTKAVPLTVNPVTNPDGYEVIAGGTFTVTFDLPVNTDTENQEYVAELYVDGNLMFGLADGVSLSPVTYVTSTDMTPKLKVTPKSGGEYEYGSSSGALYAADEPYILATYSLNKNKTFTYARSEDFFWSSSDESIATISETGVITPTGKPGTVTFRLTATNGGVEGKEAYADSVPMTFGKSTAPYLLVYNKKITSVSGEPLTVYWSSSLCDLNGETPTNFTVSLTRVDENGNPADTLQPTYTDTLTGTAENYVSFATIPGQFLHYRSGGEKENTYRFTVSSEHGSQTYSASTTVVVKSKPAKVKLTPQDSYFILDTKGSVDVQWQITDFDRFSAAESEDLFRLKITKGSTTVLDSNDPGQLNDGVYSGSYTLNNLEFDAAGGDKTGYRQTYIVSIQAKNGSDSTWSYDSYILQVYDADTLKIWVHDAEEGKLNGNELLMSNVDEIKSLSQADILAKNRDISLHNVISANYGDYVWSELADQLSWASSDNSVATINYQQGSIAEDIRRFSYVSYRPTTDFILSGLEEGTTEVTATHVLTGMKGQLDVTVKTLKDKLYLFQCYPQVKTTLSYTNGAGELCSVTSEENGAAAIYDENGIASDVYCRSVVKNAAGEDEVYTGTYYHDELASGEKDSTQRELYPCNNLTLRRAAFAYLYLKNPDGTPYVGDIVFRGGVYVNNQYKPDARFALNSSGASNTPGDQDATVTLGSDGKLEVVMDQTQWDLPQGHVLHGDKVFYFFFIKKSGATDYYPLFASVDATANLDEFVAAGSAVSNFRKNPTDGAHPYVAAQSATMRNSEKAYEQTDNILDKTGYIGISNNVTECAITSLAVWWGKDQSTDKKIRMNFDVDANKNKIFSEQNNRTYPFIDEVVTSYTVLANDNNIESTVSSKIKQYPVNVEYYEGETNLVCTEAMNYRISNMKGYENVQDSKSLAGELQNMGMAMNADAPKSMGSDDKFVQAAMQAFSYGTYCVGHNDFFCIHITPTSDPTKFLGYISVNHADSGASINMLYPKLNGSIGLDGGSLSASSVLQEAAMLCTSGRGSIDSWEDYKAAYLSGGGSAVGHNGGVSVGGSKSLPSKDTPANDDVDLDDFDNPDGSAPTPEQDKKKPKTSMGWSASVGGYMESLIYYNFETGRWTSRVLDGGFSISGSASYKYSFPTFFVGPVPFTVSLTLGGSIGVSMDAITAAYVPSSSLSAETATEFLTELRISLFMKVFAGIGIDYLLFSFKIGVFGKLSFDVVLAWLNRPYLSKEGHEDAYLVADGKNNTENANLNGQSYSMTGTIGLELSASVAGLSWSKTLLSLSTSLSTSSGDWGRINTLWKENQANLHWSIEQLLKKQSATLVTAGDQQMVSVEMAPTVESRSYLEDGGRSWSGGVQSGMLGQTLTLGDAISLESNTYPYANPVLNDDGSLLLYISDMNSDDISDARAAFAVKGRTGSYVKGGAIDAAGLGDQHVSVAGDKDFSVAAWSRRTVDLDKDAGEVVHEHEQYMMLHSSDVYASIFNGSTWETTCLTESSGSDVTPVVCTNGSRAVVAWRSGLASNESDPTSFDEEDTILYKIYENGTWSETKSLYNGTAGAIMGVDSAMLQSADPAKNGVACVAYVLDHDGSNDTVDDREIDYALIGLDGEVTRTVCATPDDTMVTNPQLAAVTFPADETNEQRFVLGWYTYDNPDTRDDSDDESDEETGNADICFLDFNEEGIIGKNIPHSISQMAGEAHASIPSDFRFTNGAKTIENLSMVWIEREEDENAPSDVLDAEHDVLKSVKFFCYGENNDQVDISSPLDVADMPEGTLIDTYDAISESGNKVSAAILGTTYGPELVTKSGETIDGDTVEYTVPKAVSALFTATDVYTEKISVPVLLADYETVKRGTNTLVEVDVRNDGYSPVTAVTVEIGDAQTTLTGLNLMPGDAEKCWVDYVVPTQRVVDPSYTVTATFDSGAEEQAQGTVYLDIPDLMITDARVMREEEGERDIQVCLYNGTDAALENIGRDKNSKRSVKISFYSDPTYENQIESLEPVIVSDEAELRMIDEGGYACQVTFDAAAYVRENEDEIAELPTDGLPVYIKTEVLDHDGIPVGDTNLANNNEAVNCENLGSRTESDVLLSGRTEVNDGTSTVTIDLQNAHMKPLENGNLTVTLLDENGEVLAQQQSFNGNYGEGDNGLITLKGEEKQTFTFTFDQVGASAEFTYAEMNFERDVAELNALTLSDIKVTLDDFVLQPNGSLTANVAAKHLSSTTITAVAANTSSSITVKVDRQPAVKHGARFTDELTLNPDGISKITILVETDTGKKQTYVLTVANNLGSHSEEPTEDNPTQENDQAQGVKVCKWCGEVHTGISRLFIGVFHTILYFFARLFRLK